MADDEGPGEWVPDGSAVMPEIPAELNVHPLLLAVLHATVFLDGSEDDVVDPDASVEAMEYMATYLQRLGGADLRRVKEDLQVLIAYAKDQDWPKPQVRYFKEFLSNYGIGEEGKA
jgi:hypothetical protein